MRASRGSRRRLRDLQNIQVCTSFSSSCAIPIDIIPATHRAQSE